MFAYVGVYCILSAGTEVIDLRAVNACLNSSWIHRLATSPQISMHPAHPSVDCHQFHSRTTIKRHHLQPFYASMEAADEASLQPHLWGRMQKVQHCQVQFLLLLMVCLKVFLFINIILYNNILHCLQGSALVTYWAAPLQTNRTGCRVTRK